jgi:hypothetical protein
VTGRWEVGRDAGEGRWGDSEGREIAREGSGKLYSGGGPKPEASQLTHSRTQSLRTLLLAPRLF